MRYIRRDPKVTSAIMRTIRSKGTKVEIIFGKALRECGIKYKKYYGIEGKPDFVVLSHKIAIFVDGDFWHGHGWRLRGFKRLEDSLKSNKKFWIKKIRTNVARDKKVSRLLRKEGWKVFRFWESDVKKNALRCASKILSHLE